MESPEYVQIEPVGQCNLRCVMCPVQFRHEGEAADARAFMAFATFTRLVDQFVGLKHLHLQGLGEPLLHPRFFDMVRYAVARGIRVTTNTNLTLLTPARAAMCVSSGLDEVHGSIDGANADTFERIRPRARFARVTSNLRALVEARRRARSTHPRIQIVMVLMRRNLAELPQLVCLAHELGADSLFVQRLCHDYGEAGLPAKYRAMRDYVAREALADEDSAIIEEGFAHARRLAQERGIELRLPRVHPRWYSPDTPGRQRCDWPWRGAYVSYRGEAMPCCMVSTPDRACLGDMAQEGVEAVWNGSAYENFRARLASERPPDVCASCAVYAGVF